MWGFFVWNPWSKILRTNKISQSDELFHFVWIQRRRYKQSVRISCLPAAFNRVKPEAQFCKCQNHTRVAYPSTIENISENVNMTNVVFLWRGGGGGGGGGGVIMSSDAFDRCRLRFTETYIFYSNSIFDRFCHKMKPYWIIAYWMTNLCLQLSNNKYW